MRQCKEPSYSNNQTTYCTVVLQHGYIENCQKPSSRAGCSTNTMPNVLLDMLDSLLAHAS